MKSYNHAHILGLLVYTAGNEMGTACGQCQKELGKFKKPCVAMSIDSIRDQSDTALAHYAFTKDKEAVELRSK